MKFPALFLAIQLCPSPTAPKRLLSVSVIAPPVADTAQKFSVERVSAPLENATLRSAKSRICTCAQAGMPKASASRHAAGRCAFSDVMLIGKLSLNVKDR